MSSMRAALEKAGLVPAYRPTLLHLPKAKETQQTNPRREPPVAHVRQSAHEKSKKSLPEKKPRRYVLPPDPEGDEKARQCHGWFIRVSIMFSKLHEDRILAGLG